MTTVLTMLTPQDDRQLRGILDGAQFVVENYQSVGELWRAMAEPTSTIVLCDEANSWKAILRLSREKYSPKVIVCSRLEGEWYKKLASEVMTFGAYDLLHLPFEAETVRRVMKIATASKAKAAH